MEGIGFQCIKLGLSLLALCSSLPHPPTTFLYKLGLWIWLQKFPLHCTTVPILPTHSLDNFAIGWFRDEIAWGKLCILSADFMGYLVLKLFEELYILVATLQTSYFIDAPTLGRGTP